MWAKKGASTCGTEGVEEEEEEETSLRNAQLLDGYITPSPEVERERVEKRDNQKKKGEFL